jgi:bacteriocin biosynthesis cyclodehydratase domain-containing protein
MDTAAERPAVDTGWRPKLVAGLRPVWRDGESVQFGVDPDRAVVVEGVTERWMRLLLDLDGRRTDGQVLAAASAADLDPGAAERLLADLRAAGLLTDAVPEPVPAAVGVTPLPMARSGAAQRAAGSARLAADRAALTLLAGPDRHPDAVLTRRRHTAVIVHGAGRLGAPLAALLGAAGIGHVHLLDTGWVRPVDLAPGGAVATDLHRRRDEVGVAAVRRVAPEAGTGALPPHRPADLVVLTGDRALDTDLVDSLHAGGIAHLAVAVRETTAVVGPLVLPGQSACLRCADLHRADRDPAWPLLAAQLSGPRPPLAVEPCDVTLAAIAAALGAAQVLGHLAGDPTDAVGTLGGTLELAAPGWRIRRRTWPPHPACRCGAAYAQVTGPEQAARGRDREQGE